HGLQNLLSDTNLFCTVAAGSRGERDANRVADAFLEQDSHGCAGGDNALCAHPGFRQAEVQRLIASGCESAIHVDQVLHPADFRAQDDLVGAQAAFLRQLSGVKRTDYHGFHGYFAGIFRLVETRIFVHHARKQSLVERSPIHADTHRFLILDRDFDHGAEIPIILATDPYVAGIDTVFGEIARALGILSEQLVTVIVEVADDGHAHALFV